MHAFAEETAYPDNPVSIPASHIALLDEFFQIVDFLPSSPSEFQEFAQIFTADGVWKTTSAVFRGEKELKASGSERVFLQGLDSMRHWVRRVYKGDVEGKEIMLFGLVKLVTKGGKTFEVDFGARVVISVDREDELDRAMPRLKFFQGWSAQVSALLSWQSLKIPVSARYCLRASISR